MLLFFKEPPTPTHGNGPPIDYISGVPHHPPPPPQGHPQGGVGLNAPPPMGKFCNKSVPDLSMVNNNSAVAAEPPMGLTPSSVPGGGHSSISRSSSNYLDPGSLMISGEPRRHSTSGVPGYTLGHSPYYSQRPEDILNSYENVEKNEIVTRAKKMAIQADDMFDFTRGQGRVKTTQDLFTLAEYFAEEVNILYKVIRLFTYDVPTGEDKRIVMALADNVPKHCHQLQMLIQSPTVGKAATFTKVDSIIKETRAIINLVLRVIQMCYNHSKKYNLDFSNVSLDKAKEGIDDSSLDTS